MPQKPLIAVFSGPTATISNSPPLVTSNKARLPGERSITGRFDPLVPQILHEPVTVRIKKFTAHPLESDASEVYQENGKDYYEVTLRPEDGPYPLPYMARRRKDETPNGVPFEANDLFNAAIDYGGRQAFYPDAARIFTDIDRTISGRSEDGEANMLDNKAKFDFIRALPPGGYTKKGEIPGVDFFPYKPYRKEKSVRYGDLAKVANIVQRTIASGGYNGAIWLEGSPRIEETLYWLSLLTDTDLPIVGSASQRAHGEISNDGDRNIIDAVDYIVSGKGVGVGAVAVQDQVIYAARELKKGDDRPGGYKATGGHGGILGTVKSSQVTIWYKPNYKHTSTSDVNMTKLPERIVLADDKTNSSEVTSLETKNPDGMLRAETIPRVHVVKYSNYSQEDEREEPEQEVDIMARIEKAMIEQRGSGSKPKLHGLVLEGTTPYARGTVSQMKALEIAALSGMPVVRVARSDPGGRVVTVGSDLFIEGSNLDSSKARLLLIASMLKLGRFPRASDPRNPTSAERQSVIDKAKEFQDIFETH